jgi:hypothetical protein
MKAIWTKTAFLATAMIASQFSFGQLTETNPETLVNTTTAGTQERPAVAMDTSGRYAVVWESENQDGDGYGVYAKIYNADHSVRVTDFLVNTINTTNDQRHPDVAITPSGAIAIVWQTNHVNTSDWDTYISFYTIDGVNVVGESLVSNASTDNQMHPKVAAGDNAFAVTYMTNTGGTRNHAIEGRQYDASGIPLGAAYSVVADANHNAHPSVALDSAGNVVYAWQFKVSIVGVTNISAQRYDNAGVALGGPLTVTTGITNNKTYPSVSMDKDGRFAIAYSKFDADGDHYGIFGVRYDATATPVGSEFQINTNTNGSQDHPQLNCSRDGAYFAATWTDESNDGDRQGVYSRVFSWDLTFLNTDQLINTTTAERQMLSDVAIGANTTEAVYVWQGGLRKAPSTGTDTDEYGVYTNALQVADIIPPTAVCQNITVFLDGSGNATITPADVDGGSSDNVGIVSSSLSQSSFTCANIGPNLVTLTVTDGAGLTDDCLATVTIADSTSPVVVCQNITVFLDGSGNASITAGDVDAGSTDNCSLAGLSVTPAAFTCANVGLNSVTLTATDASGNIASCNATVTVIDSIAPVANCQNITVFLDGAGLASITAVDVDNGSSDNCALAGLSVSPALFTCANLGANNVTLTATDASGNISQCTATVTVSDTTSPTAVCQNITVFLDGAGSASITAADVDGGSSDNCALAGLSVAPALFTCANIGANNVTLTATDASGNISQCTAVVTVADTTSPIVSCQDITVFLDGSGNATISAVDVNNGSSDNCGTPALSVSQSSFTCANVGANTVTLTAMDASGNIAQCTATVTVSDTTSPTASCQNISVVLDGSGNASITAGDVDNGSSDNCGLAGLSVSPAAFTCADVGPNMVTLTAIDASGNTSQCTATVTVSDTTSPTVVCQNITVFLDGSGSASITAADVDGGSSDNCAIAGLSVSPALFTCANIGANNVTLTATDASGNISQCTAVVTVADTASPVASCQNITVFLDGAGLASITAGDVDNGSTDNCGTPTLSVSPSTFTCADIGSNMVTLTATDAFGNISQCTATVTVSDTTSPIASCQNISVVLDGSGNASITAGDVDNGSSDNCGLAGLSVSPAAFTCADVGPNTVTLTATDASGNTSQCTATVTVSDTTSPTAVCQNITVFLDGTGSASITAADVDGGSSDNCGTPALAVNVSSFNCSDIGTNIVTLTATDGSGNISQCTAVVTVADTTSPDLPTLATLTGECAVTATAPTTTDNCAGTITGTTTDPLSYFAEGTYTITWTFDDGNGNTVQADQTVVVDDVTPPAVPIIADATGECGVTVSAPTTTDNCSGTITGTTTDPLSYAAEGTYTITWSFDDGNGNVSNATQTVIVDDITDPVVPTLVDLTDACSVSATAPTTTDNCAGTITGTTTDPVVYTGGGTFVITWTFDDGNGNVVTADQNVIITDTVAPTASDLDTVFASCISDVAIDITLVDDEADNCTASPIVTYVGDVSLNGGACTDTIIRTYNVADDAGNSIDVSQVIIVNDTVAPTASNPATLFVVCLDDVPTGAGATAWVIDEADNCSVPTVTLISDVSSNGTGCNDTITRVFEVADACGNAITVTQLIVINDDVNPVVDAPALADVVGYCDLTPATPTATDNCSGSINGVPDVAFPINTLGTTVVTWTYTDDCGNTTTQTQNVIVEQINVGTFFASDGITIVSSNNDPGVTFQWIDCATNQELPGETNQNFTPTYSSDFAVIVTQDGCVDTSACVTITEVSLDNITSDALVIYPNPSKGQFTIDYDGGIQIVEMFDVLGRIVLQDSAIKNGAIDASHLAPGKYMVRVKTATEQVLVQPIVIGQN